MKYAMAVTAMVLIGGCGGMSMDVSWSQPPEPDFLVAGADPAPEIYGGVDVAPRIAEPRSPYRLRSREESTNSEPLLAGTLHRELRPLPLEKLDPRVPESPMVPWRGFGLTTPPVSAFLWSRVVPGAPENGLFGPVPGWAR
ncbi:MAG TPA: hypothetical protein VG457_10095 [Planctomycetota bacterium]|jgi:hypothetical protein|nr:hypothetical protein [Planctomycetota bacterium]